MKVFRKIDDVQIGRHSIHKLTKKGGVAGPDSDGNKSEYLVLWHEQ